MSSSFDPVSLTVGIGLGVVIMAVVRRFGPSEASSGQINPAIQKSEPKVATMCKLKDVEDLLKDKPAAAYCRCWRSKTFPMCDGTHAQFNKETGDNTGPLVFKK
mmetsp:Transcript_13193/g.34374  ORF Transcript_13193/g.34374 Transcript_13193/m.34374 type:complete len:104 (-) Transcript_13193:391-702(-)|eukprot:CAMPEP_0119414044 /NCGR_PEP_ID=MMETSP1335-20130426/6420_1 /TAXON_ID=259385 /ORGANISM="Chrysoculter rhomboideus, Strain RCC1486" /LENGTH=103 /DNA_ID=CAMNT_0007438895 /DNA_START=53 /DNA_END=364 /DNA_ORIENTATION=+